MLQRQRSKERKEQEAREKEKTEALDNLKNK